MAKLYKQTISQYFFDVKFLAGQALIPSKNWEFIRYRVEIYDDFRKLAPSPLVDSEGTSYYYELTKLYNDKDWEWVIEIRPSFIQFVEDPAGSRIAQILIAEYSVSEPEEDWDDDFGVFVRWIATMQESGVAASEERTTIINLARSRVRLLSIDFEQTQKFKLGNKLFLGVLVRQTTPISLNMSNADISFRFTRSKRTTV